ncbi:MAG: polysaccharide pyruvyl transferase CsaB [Clostridia bacterium]|nr:polysaccharide pyruvyl transferase CsaB [Clostridia bacterium]
MNNILLVTMSLDIGGAETHFIELACALKKRGYNVVCASRGGSYVSVLETADIKHYRVPLTSKHPASILRAYRMLEQIVAEEKTDIVHAHARIPAFICHFLCKKKNIVFVTTAHGAYSTGTGLKYVTRWGQKTLAVSEDIKRYLLDNYKLDEKNITVTINGISSERFSPGEPDDSVYDELSIPRGGRNIVYLGRINFDSGEYAFRLARLAPRILERAPDANIVIIGAGDRFEELSREVEAVNSLLPRKVVYLTGARTDVDRLLRIASLVIAVSRAALEAMSCEKRVLLAGDFGYMGLYSEDMTDACINNNFTCRGFEKPADEVFLSDILRALSEDAETSERVRRAGRALVMERYSIERMTDDAISVYEKVRGRSYGKKYDFLILGYYGFNNSGDDALLDAVIQNLLSIQPGLSLCVLSNMSMKLRNEKDIDFFDRFNIISVIRTLKHSETLIYGGGNLIQDVTSTKSLIYYVSVLFCAQIMGAKTMLYSNGVGPVNKKFNRYIVKKIVNNVDVITLRESISHAFLNEIGVTKPDIYETADITLTIDPPAPERIDEILRAENIPPEDKFVCVSVRNWKNNPASFEGDLARALDEIYAQRGFRALFIPFHEPFDRDISKRVMALMNTDALVLSGKYNAQDIIGVISRSELVLGMRLHSLIFGTAAGVRLCGIVYDEKVRGFLDSVHVPDFVNIDDATYVSISDALACALDKRPTAAMRASYASLKERALLNSKYAIELLGRKNF